MLEATAQLELLTQIMLVVSIAVATLEVFGLVVLTTLILAESRKGNKKRSEVPLPAPERVVLTKT